MYWGDSHNQVLRENWILAVAAELACGAMALDRAPAVIALHISPRSVVGHLLGLGAFATCYRSGSETVGSQELTLQECAPGVGAYCDCHFPLHRDGGVIFGKSY